MTKATLTKNFYNTTVANKKFTPYSIWTKSENIATPPKDFYHNVRKDDIGTLAEAAIAEEVHMDLIGECLLPCNEGLKGLDWVCLTTDQLLRLKVITPQGEKAIQTQFGIDILILPRKWVEEKRTLCGNDLATIRSIQVKYQPTCPSYKTANVETHKFIDGVRVETGINKTEATWHVWAINGHCNIMMKTEELRDLTLNNKWSERVTAAHKKGDMKKSTFTLRVDLLRMMDLPSSATLTMRPEFAAYFNKAHSSKQGVTTNTVAAKYYTQPWDEFALRLFLTEGLSGFDRHNATIKAKKDHIQVYGDRWNLFG